MPKDGTRPTSASPFDQAAFAGIARNATSFSADAAYFVDRHDRAAHLYVTRVSSLEAIDRRLEQIQDQITMLRAAEPAAPTGSVLHRLSKRGWKFADAARHILDSPAAPHDRAGQMPQ